MCHVSGFIRNMLVYDQLIFYFHIPFSTLEKFNQRKSHGWLCQTGFYLKFPHVLLMDPVLLIHPYAKCVINSRGLIYLLTGKSHLQKISQGYHDDCDDQPPSSVSVSSVLYQDQMMQRYCCARHASTLHIWYQTFNYPLEDSPFLNFSSYICGGINPTPNSVDGSGLSYQSLSLEMGM